MSNNQSSQKSLAISICLLFLLVPLLGIIDFPEDLEVSEDTEFSSVSKTSSAINSPGSERGSVFTNSVLEINAGSPTLVLNNGSLVSFDNGSPIFSEGDVISIYIRTISKLAIIISPPARDRTIIQDSTIVIASF